MSIDLELHPCALIASFLWTWSFIRVPIDVEFHRYAFRFRAFIPSPTRMYLYRIHGLETGRVSV